jgi:hypothetical protein
MDFSQILTQIYTERLYLHDKEYISICGKMYDEDQWRYSLDRALASLTGFMIVL